MGGPVVGYGETMADPHVERERTFEVPEDFTLPALPDARPHRLLLRASYFDTDDALLQARGVTLRRRTGGSDDGWHLKIPHPDGRLELRTEVGPSRPPRALTDLTRGLRFDRPLRRRAVLRTQRNALRLYTPDGRLVAEVADDEVHAATDAPSDGPERWREIEIELGPAGTQEEMERLTDLVTGAGATPAGHGSKYDRAVTRPIERPPLSGLAGLVDDYLQTQYRRITLGDLRMRRGENAVHKTRVAVRRTRSTLRTFGALFDPDRSGRLDRDLAWYAEALGRVRDLDIVRRHVADDLDRDQDDPISREAGDRLLRMIDSERQQAWDETQVILSGRRYGSLLRQLDDWRREAPWVADDDTDVETFVKKAEKKSRKRLARATSRADAPDTSFHRARKAAKRTRYAAELARPAWGKPAKRVAQVHEKRQDALGEVQDHVMIVDALRSVASARATPSKVGFTCGMLAERHLRAKADARARQR
jgi:CHAD domain-containing protein